MTRFQVNNFRILDAHQVNKSGWWQRLLITLKLTQPEMPMFNHVINLVLVKTSTDFSRRFSPLNKLGIGDILLTENGSQWHVLEINTRDWSIKCGSIRQSPEVDIKAHSECAVIAHMQAGA